MKNFKIKPNTLRLFIMNLLVVSLFLTLVELIIILSFKGVWVGEQKFDIFEQNRNKQYYIQNIIKFSFMIYMLIIMYMGYKKNSELKLSVLKLLLLGCLIYTVVTSFNLITSHSLGKILSQDKVVQVYSKASVVIVLYDIISVLILVLVIIRYIIYVSIFMFNLRKLKKGKN
ncbi:hypothetical protein SCHIN_v1c01830 [Spiroplasma chinense]|uniref:Uncharacterized protein n=1 Tax=Spiroplasma chinense TaxID=216932 RepID=A0A5B9Y349_9MOLU|nr:hypothetical protein [Spiroplasma chinense]QEH61381.1 hypothetical protein SCHIN_v1c01830 [Spiroplasma chinense]